LPFFAGVTIIIIVVLSSGCLDSPANSSSGGSSGSPGSCSPGYSEYTTSGGHCCPSGYPYYYEGTCHQCSQGYNTYDTSAGHCCPSGYPYYYDGTCHTKSSGSSTVVVSSGQVDSSTGCPATYDLQCSGWIEGTRCQIQSCTCYWSGIHGDSTNAYYHTSDNAYFRCTGSGQTISCIAAAQAAAQHCT
jgi:hypothetical protein